MARIVTAALAAKVITEVAAELGMDPADFRTYPGSHEGLDDRYKVIGAEGAYPNADAYARTCDYWTDATGHDGLTDRLAKLGVYLEPSNVCNAGIFFIRED